MNKLKRKVKKDKHIMKNQNGFALLSGLLIVTVVALIGFSGWYISAQNKSSDELSTSESKNAPETKTSEQTDDSDEQTIPEGLKRYEKDKNGFSFLYPHEWGDANVTDLEWDHEGKGFRVVFSNTEISGMMADTGYKYSGHGRGGINWELSDVDFMKIVESIKNSAKLAETSVSYSTAVLHEGSRYIIYASGDCLNHGAYLTAAYRLSENDAIDKVLNLSVSPKNNVNCEEVTNKNVVSYFSQKTIDQLRMVGLALN